MASKKREREPDFANSPSNSASSPTSTGGGASTTNFRNVSACNRCRNRKNRCDQKLPKCTNCEKANVDCVGFDPVSKREIPRSYVYYLETRVRNLEAILLAHQLEFPPPANDFTISEDIKPGINVPFPIQDEDAGLDKPARPPRYDPSSDVVSSHHDPNAKLNKLVDNIGMVSVHGASDLRYRASASTSGISFARVVFAAVKRSKDLAPTPSERGGSRSGRQSHAGTTSGGSPIRDSFFGLGCRSTVKAAPFPDRELGARLADLYFEHANPQIPVLHRGEFMALFERVYADDPKKRSPREMYMLYIVFAIGSGHIVGSAGIEQTTSVSQGMSDDSQAPGRKRQKTISHQHQPEEYHSAAIYHLENFLGSPPSAEGVGGGLEELQAVCLLAGLALLRPVAPGLWYIIGVAMRLSIDLGLHIEEVDPDLDSRALHPEVGGSTSAVGRKQWTRDLRRRLWWCVFNLDRLVSSCVGRPVSIYEATVTTEFPSLVDDELITTSGFLIAPSSVEAPSYKFVTHHYLRLRLLQSEILQVFQHRQADGARQMGAFGLNGYIIPDLKSAFLQRFHSFRDWRADLDRRLWEWKQSAPSQLETGVAFSTLFLDLNYWQAIIMLYRQSLSVPEQLANELSPATGDDVQSPNAFNQEREEDKQMVFLKVAQAGQTVLKTYRQLHRLKRVNYTFLATHHLFMSGISFLYAIWHSDLVRSQLTIDDVDFTVLAATSVLNDLAEKCQPAEACRESFVNMSRATISMVMSTTGFGNSSTLGAQRLNDPASPPSAVVEQVMTEDFAPRPADSPSRRLPKFDMNLKDLFSDEELATRPLLDSTQTSRRPSAIETHGPGATSLPFHHPSLLQGEEPNLPYPVLDSPAYNPSFSVPSAQPSEFAFGDLDFLNNFPTAADPHGILWDVGGDGLLASGNGMGFDVSGAYDASGELLDNFFFGNNANGF